MSRARLSREAGFALPLTLFLIGVLTVMLSAALARTGADRRIAESTGGDQDALAVAQGGLNTYLDTKTTRPNDGDSTRLYVSNGYADVVARLVRRPADTLVNRTYIIKATGYLLDPGSLGAEPRARRVVAQFAQWQTATMDVRAGFVAANGLRRRGDQVEIRGVDQCGVRPSVNAIRTRYSGVIPSANGWDLYGPNPDVYEFGNAAATANSTDIDWAATLSTGLTPHYTTVQTWDFTYPIQRVMGNATLGQAGQITHGSGLLIVSGNLRTLGNTVQWYGIILVGGRIDFDASSTFVDGAVVSGLNEQLGQNVGRGDLGDRYTDIDYNSCYVDAALASLKGLVARSGWLDAWATY